MATDRLARIGRLAMLARGLEREGVYNGAKLARALLERELLHHADALFAARPGALADDVAALRAELADEGGEEGLLAALAATEVACRDGATLSLAEAPPAHSCRACGELFITLDPPGACPTCEAPALSFREHLPVWYLEPAEPATVLGALADTPTRVRDALAGRDDAALSASPSPGEWSARDTLEHLAFTEQLLEERVSRLLDEDDPDLRARAMWAETTTSDEGSARTGEPTSVLLARYLSMRTATLGRLRRLEPAQWQRPGRHPEWGRVTVLGQAAYFARHEASHLAQLAAAAEGRLPGQR
jgi:hypothetical protein